jgi:hypothetical protein
MGFEQTTNEIGRHRKVEHVPQHRRKGGNHMRVVDEPMQPHSLNALSATRKVPSVPTEVGLAGVTDRAIGQTPGEDGIARVRDSLKRIERREALDRMIKDREKVGCVIRAVESAFSAKATIQETAQRLADVREITRRYATGQDTYDNLREEDVHRVTAYYNDLKTHDSQLGEAMRGYTLSVKEMTSEEIKQAIQDGGKVLASTRIRYKGQDMQHLMHIDYFDSTGRFVDASDNGSGEVNAPSYFCFVFDKAAEMDDK